MLQWIPLEMEYSRFLLFCFETDLDEFYPGLRWDGWQQDVMDLRPDYAYSFFPFLWTEEATDINTIERNAIPIEEVYSFNMESMNIKG